MDANNEKLAAVEDSLEGFVSSDGKQGTPENMVGFRDEDSTVRTINEWIKGEHDFTCRLLGDNGTEPRK